MSLPRSIGFSKQGGLLPAVSLVLGGLLAGLPDADVSAAPRAEIRTRHAVLVGGNWQALPDWAAQVGVEPLETFRRGCGRLRQRLQWRSVCDAADSVRGDDPAEIRAFFEREFVPYRLHDPSRGGLGLLTGYFEPVAKGAEGPGGRFVHPVYGVPEDLIRLDARSLPPMVERDRLMVKIEGGEARPVEAQGQPPESGLHRLDLSSVPAMPLDRRLRLRLSGDRLLPYLTRQEIDAGFRPDAPILAWIDDPDALYVIQVQGSGRIRFPDGRELRLGYGEQNGHPFAPRGSGASSRTRGLGNGGEPSAGGGAPGVSAAALAMFSNDGDEVALAADPGQVSRTRSITASPRIRDKAADDAAVERIIEELLAQAKQPSARANLRTEKASEVRDRVVALYRLVGARRHDPSYVFFRPLPAPSTGGSLGPPGALGVPLTPGRSVAVDPRVTPLGAPVFISAQRESADTRLNRLVVAQDVGGAIRGAVRADLFWGRGAQAGNLALKTRDTLSMWVLLPRAIADSRPLGSRTRGIGLPQAAAPGDRAGSPMHGDESLPECLIVDGEYCPD